MKQKIYLTENEFETVIKNSVIRILSESYNDDDEFWKNERDAEMDYDYNLLKKANQQANGTYHAKSEESDFQTGDKVIVHTKRGDITGIIVDFDKDSMNLGIGETAEVKYRKEDGRIFTMIGVPINKMEKVQ